MKKLIFTLIGCIGLIGSAYAVPVREKENFKTSSQDFKKHEIAGDITVNGKTFHLVSPQLKNKIVGSRNAATTPLITQAPGKKQLYCKDAVGYALGSPFQTYAIASSINWDGDDAYFLDIITAAPMGTYVKASMANNKLVMPMHQTVLIFNDEDYDINLGLLRPVISVDKSGGEEEIYIWFEYTDDYDQVTYSKDKYGSWTLDNLAPKYEIGEIDPADYNFPYYVIGYYYTDEYEWVGYCDVYQTYDEFNFEPTVMPEGLPMQKMTYINAAEMGVIVSVYEDKDALYIQGLSAYLPDALFKADIIENGSKLSVAPNQYIGIEESIYYVITSTLRLNGEDDPDILDDTPAIFILERDQETGKILSIKSDDSQYVLAFNDDPFFFYPVDIFMNVEMNLQESFAGTPCTPTEAYYRDYSDLMGANYIFFELSSFADNGDIIDINNLYYAIFINGSVVEFEEENGFNLLGEEIRMYSGIKKPTVRIPYTFANDVDLYEDMGGTFVVGLYAEGIDTVGVESIYVCDDVTTYSQLVTIDTFTGEQTIGDPLEAKVETIVPSDILSVEYYDLKGMKVSNPSKGLYVKKYIMSNGSTRTVKSLIR